MQLLELANKALVTPAMYRALEASGALADVPDDVAQFMAELTALNDERNARLRHTAADAVKALNGAGIEPTLLKGMAIWASLPPNAQFSRMTSDIDLLVGPEEAQRAVTALQEAGFDLLARYEGPSTHVVAELGRPTDVGIIDLHQHPPGPPGMLAPFNAGGRAPRVEWNGSVRVSSPAHQIFLMCLHDQFHDGGYWRGGFDMRHLQDLADMTRLPQGVDWSALEALMPTRLLRNAVHTELVAAQRLTGAVLPNGISRRLAPQLQYHRHFAQHLHPRLDLVLAGSGLLLEWPNVPQHRAANRAASRAAGDLVAATPSHWCGLHPARIREIMKARPGKV
jgi:hypothetical protein